MSNSNTKVEELLARAMQELDFFAAGEFMDVDGARLDTDAAETLYYDIQQHLYDEACKKLEIIDGRPKPIVLRGYI